MERTLASPLMFVSGVSTNGMLSARRRSVPRPAAGSLVWSCGHTATIDHSLLVLELGLHRTVVDPAVVLPRPSSAVPVPRLMMW